MKTTSAEHGQNMFCDCSFHGNSMNNLLSYCGLVDAKIRASDKDLPVPMYIVFRGVNEHLYNYVIFLANICCLMIVDIRINI